MGKIWTLGGGGGADLDVVTAGANDVVAPKVIVGPDGEPISGNLVDQPLGVAASGFRNDGSNVFFVDFPKGAYRQESSVGLPSINVTAEQIRNAGGLTAAKLAQGQSAFGLTGTYKGLGNAAAADVRKGKTFSTAALSNATGTMPEQGGSTTTPGTAAKTIVAANRYVTGNIVVAGDANLVPGNIKKNVTIFGVKGTWSGYVADATDLYLQGNNPAGFSDINGGYYQFESGSIKIVGISSYQKGIVSSAQYNFSPYTKLNIDILISDTMSTTVSVQIYRNSYSGEEMGRLSNLTESRQTISIDITNCNFTDKLYLTAPSVKGYIYHIWLS